MFPVDSGDIAFVGMLITFSAFIWQVVRERNKPHVDMSEAARNLIGPYHDEVKDLRQRVEALEAEREKLIQRLAEWEIGIGVLLTQIGRAGMRPDWTPNGIQQQTQKGKSSGWLDRG